MDNKKGFTLIELLIVVVIIGILAAIAIPRFGETRERAFRSAMTSDLRNLQTLQEQYYFDSRGEGEDASSYTYASDVASLNFTPSDGVTIDITGADANGYTATANHAATDVSCTLGVNATGEDAADDGIVCSDE